MDGYRPALISRRASLVLAAPALAFLVLFFCWPVLGILGLGLAPDGYLDVQALLETWSRPWVLDVVWFSLWLATVSTILTLAVGLPAAWIFARLEFPGRALARSLLVVPFVLPTVVVSAAFLALLGPRSPIGDLSRAILGPDTPVLRLDGTVWAILLAHVFYNVAVVVRMVGGLWGSLDPRTEEAARVLGATGIRAFREVTLPLLRPAIVSAASIAFLFSVTSFGVVLILGGPRQTTLEVEIWRQVAVMLDLPAAAALTILQMVGVFLLLLASARAQERLALSQRLRPASETAHRPRTLRERIGLIAVLVGLALLLVLPLLVLVERSLAGPTGYGLDGYAALLRPGSELRLAASPLDAAWHSLAFAFGATIIAGSLGLLAAIAIGYRRGWLPRSFDALIMLPLGTSAVVVGFGFLVTLDEPPFDLRTSFLLIPIAQAVVAMPFLIRAVTPTLRAIDPRLREAAAVLGAAPARAWREVDGPILARAALVGCAFAFAVSLGEFGATLFIARPETMTVPVAIARLLGQPGAATFQVAMAMATALMVLTGASVLLIERARGGAEPF